MLTVASGALPPTVPSRAICRVSPAATGPAYPTMPLIELSRGSIMLMSRPCTSNVRVLTVVEPWGEVTAS